MKIAISLGLATHKSDKAGYCPIRIAIRGARTQTYHSTGIKVHPDNWDGQKVLRDMPNYDVINSQLAGMVADLERQVLVRQANGEHLTVDDVKAMLQPDGGRRTDFVKFYREYVDLLIATKTKKAPGTIAIWETEYKCFKAFAGERLSFKAVTHDLLDRYHVHLAQTVLVQANGVSKGYEPTTIHKKLKKLKQVILSAQRKELIKTSQVAEFEMIAYQELETNYLTLPQLQELAGRLYAGEFDFNRKIQTVVAFFLVECYGGIRFSDWPHFTIERLVSQNNSKVRAMKNKEPVYLDLSKFTSLARLLDYIGAAGLTFNLSERATNTILHSIGMRLGLTFTLTTHDGRRTFATLLGELGYRIEFIAAAMGVTPRTAARYVKLTRQSMDAEMAEKGGY